MPQPTIAARLTRRFTLLSTDPALRAALQSAVPPGWEMAHEDSLDALGEFQDVLLQRFVLLDLDEQAAFDPTAVATRIRGELMLNVPIFCFGGTAQARAAARLARADRFFERADIAAWLPRLCEQFGW